jgi:electron-transferring-flavoprotein dehydrogenase
MYIYTFVLTKVNRKQKTLSIIQVKTDSMRKIYDVVVVGCGMAGALATLTALKEGLTVCIVERKQKKYIGTKICGELMPQETLEWLRNEFSISIDYYPLKGLTICTASEHRADNPSMLRIDEPLCTIDRWQFGQVLVQELLNRGADLHNNTVRSPVHDTCVRGVQTKDSKIYGTVTIDCSGVFSILRRKTITVPPKSQLFGVAYKEDVVLEEPLKKVYATLIFDKKEIPTGYLWCFPKSEYTINVGVGRLGQGTSSLKKVLARTLEKHSFAVKKRHHAGYGVLPLRAPLPSAVYPGLLVCGDAACQINPLTGEGIAPALVSGYHAGRVAALAVKTNDVSVRGMWQYNYESAKQHGVLFGPFSLLRDFLISLSDDEFTFLRKYVITNEDLTHMESHWSFFTLKRAVLLLLNSWRNPALLYRLYRVLMKMMKVRELYENYPETPDEFPQWDRKLTSLLWAQQR